MKTNHKFYQKHLNYYQLKIKKLFKNIYDQKHINILNHKHIILNPIRNFYHEYHLNLIFHNLHFI